MGSHGKSHHSDPGGRTAIAGSSPKATPTIFQEAAAREELKKKKKKQATFVLRAWKGCCCRDGGLGPAAEDAWGQERGREGSRKAATSNAAAYFTSEAGGPRRPQPVSGLAPRPENDVFGGPGRRALTCYLTWHQVSRRERAQGARVVRGAGSARLIGDCARHCTRSAPPAAPPAAPPLLPPRLRRGKVGAERGGRPGQLTGGAGLPDGAGHLGAGPELALPPST